MEISFAESSLPSDADKAREVGHALYEGHVGVAINYQQFSLVAEIDGALVGVLEGYTAYAEVYVDDLWVDERHRGKGIGRRLLKDLEDRFADSIFDYICLCTSEFQAPDFYRKCGFELEFMRANEKNRKFNKYFFKKNL